MPNGMKVSCEGRTVISWLPIFLSMLGKNGNESTDTWKRRKRYSNARKPVKKTIKAVVPEDASFPWACLRTSASPDAMKEFERRERGRESFPPLAILKDSRPLFLPFFCLFLLPLTVFDPVIFRSSPA
jgi:hypothetical protein